MHTSVVAPIHYSKVIILIVRLIKLLKETQNVKVHFTPNHYCSKNM